jgi:hypothetical protein
VNARERRRERWSNKHTKSAQQIKGIVACTQTTPAPSYHETNWICPVAHPHHAGWLAQPKASTCVCVLVRMCTAQWEASTCVCASACDHSSTGSQRVHARVHCRTTEQNWPWSHSRRMRSWYVILSFWLSGFAPRAYLPLGMEIDVVIKLVMVSNSMRHGEWTGQEHI